MKLIGTKTLLIVSFIFIVMLVFVLMNGATSKKDESLNTMSPLKSPQVVIEESRFSKTVILKNPSQQVQVEAVAQVTEITGIKIESSVRVQLEDAIRKSPRNWENYEKLGNLLLEKGLSNEAIKLSKDCLQVDIHAPYCNDILIKAYEATGDDVQLANAISDCRKLRNGDFFCVQKARDYLMSHGDRVGAEQIVTENYPNSAEGQENLARFYFFTKEFEKSWTALDRACKLGDQYSCKELAKGYDAYMQRK